VIVVDTVTGKQIGEIPDTAGVHGIAIDRSLGRGYTSNGRDNSVTVFDLKTLKTLGKISVGQNPDAILYEPSVRRIITCNGRSNDLSVIDPVAGKVVATVKLAGKPETPASDGKTLFVNIEDKSSIERVDLGSMTSRGTWSIAPVEEPSGLAFDKKSHTLYAVGSNKLMAVVDSKSGKVIATPSIGDGPDAAGFDERRGLILSSNGEGTLTILKREKGNTYRTVQTLTTVPSARTMTLDPKTGLIYLSSAQLVPGQGRRAIAPGSFTILVVGPVRS
jgi:YVTN family beta-propeller protein